MKNYYLMCARDEGDVNWFGWFETEEEANKYNRYTREWCVRPIHKVFLREEPAPGEHWYPTLDCCAEAKSKAREHMEARGATELSGTDLVVP